MSAGQIGCAPRDITIVDEAHGAGTRTWVAICNGRRHQCSAFGSGRMEQVDCTLDAIAEGEETTARTEPTIERVMVSEGTSQIAVVRASFDIAALRYALAVAPVAHPTTVSLTVSAPLDELPPSCETGLMVDGQLTRLYGVEGSSTRARQYEFQLDIAFVRRVATAQRAVGRVCDIEWRLGEREQLVIRELLARYDEEAAWAAPQTSGGESAAPAGGATAP